MLLKPVLILLLLIGLIFNHEIYSMQTETLDLIVNMENIHELPRNFRMTTKSYLPSEKNSSPPFPSFNGLFELNASASGQFSQNSLAKMLEVIPSSKVLIVDLREESHGFINGIAVSWYGEKDWGNKDKNLQEINTDEQNRLHKIFQKPTVHLYSKSAKTTQPQIITIKEVFNESELTKKMHVQYIRIPVTDHLRPSNPEIDTFINLIKTHFLIKDSTHEWLHFHCAAGRGRSTSFIAMYDMIRNASKVSFQDILKRQALIGGKDLTQPFEVTDWRYPHHFDRLEFLHDFYNYCIENPNLEQSWTSWINK